MQDTIFSQLARQFLLAHFQGKSYIEKEKAKSSAEMSIWSMSILAGQMRFKHNCLLSSLPFSVVNQNRLSWNHGVYAAKKHPIRMGNHVYSFPKLMAMWLPSPSMAMNWFDRHFLTCVTLPSRSSHSEISTSSPCCAALSYDDKAKCGTGWEKILRLFSLTWRKDSD